MLAFHERWENGESLDYSLFLSAYFNCSGCDILVIPGDLVYFFHPSKRDIRSMQSLWSPGRELTHPFQFLQVKASHKSSPNSRGREIDSTSW